MLTSYFQSQIILVKWGWKLFSFLDSLINITGYYLISEKSECEVGSDCGDLETSCSTRLRSHHSPLVDSLEKVVYDQSDNFASSDSDKVLTDENTKTDELVGLHILCFLLLRKIYTNRSYFTISTHCFEHLKISVFFVKVMIFFCRMEYKQRYIHIYEVTFWCATF